MGDATKIANKTDKPIRLLIRVIIHLALVLKRLGAAQ
jgi:hypothetical protein